MHNRKKRWKLSSCFAVKHVAGNKYERNLFQNRFEVINIPYKNSASSRIVHSVDPPSPPLETTVKTPNTIRRSLFIVLEDILKSFWNWSTTSKEIHSLFKCLKQNIRKSKGWTQLILPMSIHNEKKNISPAATSLFVFMKNFYDCFLLKMALVRDDNLWLLMLGMLT